MGSKGAAEILFKKEISSSENPELALSLRDIEYRDKFANPYLAAEHGYIDDVIEPAKTRQILINALKILENKKDTNPQKKHGNIPL